MDELPYSRGRGRRPRLVVYVNTAGPGTGRDLPLFATPRHFFGPARARAHWFIAALAHAYSRGLGYERLSRCRALLLWAPLDVDSGRCDPCAVMAAHNLRDPRNLPFFRVTVFETPVRGYKLGKPPPRFDLSHLGLQVADAEMHHRIRGELSSYQWPEGVIVLVEKTGTCLWLSLAREGLYYLIPYPREPALFKRDDVVRDRKYNEVRKVAEDEIEGDDYIALCGDDDSRTSLHEKNDLVLHEKRRGQSLPAE